MKLVIDNIILFPGQDVGAIHESPLPAAIKERYGIDFDFDCTVLRKSLDARNKQRIVYRYRVAIEVPDDKAAVLLQDNDISVYKAVEFPVIVKRDMKDTVLIVGAGPAGLFCALRLIEAGCRVEIFERGKRVEERMKDIEILEKSGILNEQSNVLFGEGGAGAYSDGKLVTRTGRPEIAWLFDKLVELGAP